MGVTRFPRYSKRITNSKRWKGLRHKILRRDHFRCVMADSTCSGRLEVDHIKPVRTHPSLAWSEDNLQTLCTSHHTAKTRVECGHPPSNPERLKWKAAVMALSKDTVL